MALGSMRLLFTYQRTSSPPVPGVPVSVTAPTAHSMMLSTVGWPGFVFIVIVTGMVSL